MNRIVKYWNHNRGKIFITLIIIAFFLIIIQGVGNILKAIEEEAERKASIDRSKPVESVITGEVVSEEKTDQNVSMINKFVENCNNKEYGRAFSLLTNACKKEFKNEVSFFTESYCKKVFETKKTYALELWFTKDEMYTYKIKFYEDNLLQVGGANIDKRKEDYITVMEDNGESKISINNFITEKTISKSHTVEGVEIIINSKKIYKNYEVYNVTIKNHKDSKIIISKEQENEDICLIDKNNVEYVSFLNEFPSGYLMLEGNREINVNIKFNKMYDLYRVIERIKFKNILIYNEDINTQSENEINNIVLEIEI